MSGNIQDRKPILVIGAGISGISAALEASEAGCEVTLIDSEPFLGGRVARTYRYFPKLCPPYCGLEINYQRLKKNPGIRCCTLTEVESLSGRPGDYRVSLTVRPRFVNGNCTVCGECERVCPVSGPDEFNYGMNERKAVYLPHEMSFPQRYVVDPKICLGKECSKCVEVCRYQAIDLDAKEERMEGVFSSVIVATGWKPYDAGRLATLGYGRYPNVITNVIMERLAAPNGPTKGKILRPSDNRKVDRIAFVQCAGSRDENHLPYCSAVCCSATLKQSMYVAEQNPEAEKFVFYIDVRTPGRLEDFYVEAGKDPHLHLIKGKAAKITEDPETRDLVVEAEDTASGKKQKEKVQMVVLATGMVPNTDSLRKLKVLGLDENGFVAGNGGREAVFAAGCAKRPADVSRCVQDSTGAALKALQAAVGENV
jgi:quinone-modifying oxidoreductase subunit QmoA